MGKGEAGCKHMEGFVQRIGKNSGIEGWIADITSRWLWVLREAKGEQLDNHC